MFSLRGKKACQDYMMALIVAEKQGPHGLLLVITDKELLGKTFMEGKIQLDLTKPFYHGEEKTKTEIKALLKKARDLHFTGREAVALGVEENFVESKRILYVQNVHHAL